MAIQSKAATHHSISGYQIELTAKLMRQRFKRSLRKAKAGVTIDQWVLLQQLSLGDGISQLELATAVHKDAPTVTRIIDLLVEAKLVKRGADPRDRRKFLIHLTAIGKKKIAQIIPLVGDFREEVFAGVSKPKLKEFQATLDTIFKNLQ